MKLHISKKLNYDIDKVRLASEFIIFCVDHLPIEQSCDVYIVADRSPHGISTTAVYEMGNNTCKIYGKNRAFVDVLRSIAHEMTHMMQDEMGLLTGHIRDAGGFHEDQANAKAGELIKLFAKSKKDRKAIYENRNILKLKEGEVTGTLGTSTTKRANTNINITGMLNNNSKPSYLGDTVDLKNSLGEFELGKGKDIHINSGVDTSYINPKMLDVIKSLIEISKEKKYKTPVITSAFRGPARQARTMFNNWVTHGGKKGDGKKGNEYLIKLYKDDDLAKAMGDIFTKTGGWEAGVAVLQKKPISGHSRGDAIDIRSIGYPHMKYLLKLVKDRHPYLKINDETGYKNPHWHISVT